MFRAETGIDGNETREATKHEARTDGEKKRKGNFSDNERAAESLVAANAAPESALLERVLEIHTRKPERGDESEDDGGEKRSEEGEKQNPRVNRDGFAARQRRVLGNEREEAAQSNLSEDQPRGHAREREKQAFHEELPNDAGARSTQCRTNSQLAKATSSAHEKKICDIGARNKKKKPNGREQHPKRTADASRDIFEHRKDIGAPALVVVGASLDRKVSNAKHVLLGLAERNARFEARNHRQETASLPFLGAGQG